jgi:hypothetical protein
MRVGYLVLCLVAAGLLLGGCAGGETKGDGGAAPAAKPAAAAPAPAPVSVPAKLAGPFALDADGFINNWLIVGPFPNPGERPDNKGFGIDYLKGYGGEAGHVPAAGMEIATGGLKDGDKKPVKWQAYAGSGGTIDFFAVPHLKLEDQQDDILTYSACWVESDKDQEVEVRVGSDDGYKLWIDNKHIKDVHEYRSAEQDQETYPVQLKAGKKTLVLIKVDQDWGGYCFMLRVVTKDGKKASGIKVWN